jgi:hypothetical protein
MSIKKIDKRDVKNNFLLFSVEKRNPIAIDIRAKGKPNNINEVI